MGALAPEWEQLVNPSESYGRFALQAAITVPHQLHQLCPCLLPASSQKPSARVAPARCNAGVGDRG